MCFFRFWILPKIILRKMKYLQLNPQTLLRSNGLTSPVRVTLTEAEKSFTIEVGDDAPSVVQVPHGKPAAEAAEETDELGLAVISGLVDDVEVIADEHGGAIRMSWPTLDAAFS